MHARSSLLAGVRNPRVFEALAAKAACKLLVKRGLTEEVLAHAEWLLNSFTRPPPLPAKIEPTKADLAKAEETMWAWYLEWSAIARNVIHDRRLLRALGFLTASGSPISDAVPLRR